MIDYFAHFSLDQRFNIDHAVLKRLYIQQSKQVHPDFFSLEDNSQQDKMLDLATLNNTAYKVLAEESTRIKHILELNDMMPAEGEAKVPSSFLMEMMDINEQLMELEFSDDPESVRQQIASQVNNAQDLLRANVQQVMDQWDAGDKDNRILKLVLEYYLKNKYLDRIIEKLNT